ncbi:unnamed protein product [Staurois parvus]|uniref:Uncharacterized protein n=1 Tax=Staurois parvus TaxID=386267 RepID=A0ABN9ET69_9NEOB|nr:unnamed protein product [Staurois parvus]
MLWQSRGQTSAVWSHMWRWRQQQWEAILHPMTKWNPTSCVRRPESGTCPESCDGDFSSNGRPYTGTHDTLWTYGSSMRRRYGGHGRVAKQEDED